MSRYTKQSLEELKRRVDLADLVSSHVEMQRSGSAYKGLCPFHEEKSPSFLIQKGDLHYHCFGCGAHGDAIAFLMEHLGMSFREAIEALAERYGIVLEREEGAEPSGPPRTEIKAALEKVQGFYHAMLMRTEEGKSALAYLAARGIDADFIHRFGIGYSSMRPGVFVKAAEKFGLSEEILQLGGLISQGSWQRGFDLFSGRIVFPVRDAAGRTIAFSARKIDENQLGGKYINTPKTPLFIKSRVLFGLNESRRRIVKEKRAILVEGQLDALALIYAGLDITVAALGTAFGSGHVEELVRLGAKELFLAMDSDSAGIGAAIKAGDLLASSGISVRVLSLPETAPDPDSFIRVEGREAFEKLMDQAEPYLNFLVRVQLGSTDNSSTRAQGVRAIAEQISAWKDPIQVHAATKVLSELTHTPEHLLADTRPRAALHKSLSALGTRLPQRIAVEEDVIYWLLFGRNQQKSFFHLAKLNLKKEHFSTETLSLIYERLLEHFERDGAVDMLSVLAGVGESAEEELEKIAQKKMHHERAKKLFLKSLSSLLERSWLEEREQIKERIQSGTCSEDEVLELAKAFDSIKNAPPKLIEA
jgi:DNA primase